MSYIIGNKCVSLCYTACVEVCPVDCINGPINIDGLGSEVSSMSEGDLVGKQLFINPKECINCGACEPECPVYAIFGDEDETIKAEGDEVSVQKNYEFYGLVFDRNNRI